MHELSVTESILKIALETAMQVNARAITAIDLVIGDLTGLAEESVQFCFDILSSETLAAGAQLRFRRDSALCTCLECGRQAEVRPPLVAGCTFCGSPRVQVIGGRDFFIASVEIDPAEEISA